MEELQNHYSWKWAADTKGRLNAYIAEIDKQAREHFDKLIEGMKQAQGITLKIGLNGYKGSITCGRV